MNSAGTTSVVLALVSIALPLMGSLLCLVLPERSSAPGRVTTSLLAIAFSVSSILLVTQWNAAVEISWPWFSCGTFQVYAGLLFNHVSLLMTSLVLFISLCVHLYSIGYMADEDRQSTYYARLGLFTSSMTGIVLASNLLELFFCWELVSFSSYLLIGFWSDRPKAMSASFTAFLMNRMGDLMLLTGIIITGWSAGTLDIIALTPGGVIPVYVGVLIFGGVIAKSAQFPFFTWLTNAMEGPTPVSALIHAATMVAAGVYLMIRIHFLFPESVLLLAGITGLITGLVGGIGALISFDLKRILAYSTISQLGLMILAAAVGSQDASFVHLFAHAIFKALLFLAIGGVIYLSHEQDLRKAGGIRNLWIVVPLVLGAASMAGLPFTAGFISKETLVESLPSGWFTTGAIAISILTAIYVTRLMFFLISPSRTPVPTGNMPITMKIPLCVLALGCLWISVSFSPFDMNGWIMQALDSNNNYHLDLTGTVVLSSIVMAILITVYWLWGKLLVPGVNGEETNFELDHVYRRLAQFSILGLSTVVSWSDRYIIDRILHFIAYVQVGWALFTGWTDRILVDGFVSLVTETILTSGDTIRLLARGKIQSYILWSFLMLAMFILWILL